MTVNTENIVVFFTQYLQQAYAKGSKSITPYTGDVKAFLQWLEDKGQPFRGYFSRFHIIRYTEILLQ